MSYDKKFRVVAVSFLGSKGKPRTLKNLASALEDSMNQLHAEGYEVNLAGIGTCDMLVIGELLESEPDENEREEPESDGPKFLGVHTRLLLQRTLTLVGDDDDVSAFEKRLVAADSDLVRRIVRGYSVDALAACIEEMMKEAEDHESHHTAGATCSLPKRLRVVAEVLSKHLRENLQ